MKTLETTSSVSTGEFTAVFPKAAKSESRRDDRMKIQGQGPLPVIRWLGHVYQLDFELVSEVTGRGVGRVKTMIYQLLHQRSSQDFLVTLSDSMRMGDELFSLLIYLCQGARLNGVRVGIVAQSPAVRAAFNAAGNDLPLFVTDSLKNAIVRLRRDMPNVA